jgi:hypothetical protein
MTKLSSPRTSAWEPKRSALPAQALPRASAFLRAIAGEYRRAAAATHRYEQLKRKASARAHPVTHIARRIYVEFYSDC